MGIRPIQERRRSQRIPRAFHVEVSGIGHNGIPYCDQAAATNVSDRGCQVHLTREVRPGDLLTIRVVRRAESADDHDGPFLYQAVWVEACDNCGGWMAGLSSLETANPWGINFHEESLTHK
jgi:hypothetical protein